MCYTIDLISNSKIKYNFYNATRLFFLRTQFSCIFTHQPVGRFFSRFSSESDARVAESVCRI